MLERPRFPELKLRGEEGDVEGSCMRAAGQAGEEGHKPQLAGKRKSEERGAFEV